MVTMTLPVLLPLLGLHLVLAGPGPAVQLKIQEREAKLQTDNVPNAPRNPGRPLDEDDFRRASLLPPNPPRDASHIENMKMFQQLADGEVEANKHMTEPDLADTMKTTRLRTKLRRRRSRRQRRRRVDLIRGLTRGRALLWEIGSQQVAVEAVDLQNAVLP